MDRKINPNLVCLIQSYKNSVPVVSLEGSSRSGKTYSSIDFLIWLATDQKYVGTVHIVRSTFNSFKTTLYRDLTKRFPDFGLSDPIYGRQNVHSIQLFGLTIHFIGADKVSSQLGAGSDFVWFNEMMECDLRIFDQKEQRCEVMLWGDYNPSEPKHWIYEKVNRRPDVKFLRTTYLDNPFAPENQVKKIKSYEPTPENIENGTADEYMWSVYGLGLAAVREGAIITNWTVGNFPDDLPFVWAMDFGFDHDPTTLMKVAVKNNHLFVKEYLYQTGLGITALADIMGQYIGKDELIIGDAAEGFLIDDLYYKGFNIHKSVKPTLRDSIARLKEYKIICTKDCHNFQTEVVNYTWSDKRSNTPIDDHNHCIDAIRYGMHELIATV